MILEWKRFLQERGAGFFDRSGTPTAAGCQWRHVISHDERGAVWGDAWRWLCTAITLPAESITLMR